MNLDSAINDSERLIQWLDQNIDGVEYEASDRSKIACACLDMALEHQKAIVLLSAKKLHGSAAALVRSIFESYVRGVWFYHSATEQELERFKEKDKLDKTIQELIDDLEKKPPFTEGTLSNVKKVSWDVMNSFTHSGLYQVIRRHKGDEMSPNYSDKEIIDALESANSFAILTGIAIANIAKNDELAVAVFERGMKYFNKNPN